MFLYHADATRLDRSTYTRLLADHDPLLLQVAVAETQVIPVATESQTQPETQPPFHDSQGGELKRKTSGEGHRTRKKMKISLGPPVDLGD